MNIKQRFIVPMMAVLLVAPVAAASIATAQAAKPPAEPACTVDGEAIITLRPAYAMVPTIWDSIFADRDGMMQFAGAVPLANGNVVVAGDKLDSDYKPTDNILVELNTRGRPAQDIRQPTKNLNRTVDILPLDKGYLTAATIVTGKKNDQKQVLLTYFDEAYKAVKTLDLSDTVYDYTAMDLAPAVNGNGAVIAVQAINRTQRNDRGGVLFRVTADGKIMWKRSYRPGGSNQIDRVVPAGDVGYLLAGSIQGENDRANGWLLRLNSDGTIIWERSYPRGSYAVLRNAVLSRSSWAGEVITVTGQVMPYGGKPGAAWVMQLTAGGDVKWQRYLRADGYGLDGRFLQLQRDGRSVVLLNAAIADAEDTKRRDHIRMVTLSPRGELLFDEPYQEGERARAVNMATGPDNERIITAIIQTSSKSKASASKVELITDALERKEREAKMAAQENLFGPPRPQADQILEIAKSIPDHIREEGWLFVATGLEPYTDPCVIPKASPAAP